MAKALKVYGLLTFARHDWPIEPTPNGNQQVRVVVAATSKAQAIEALLPLLTESRHTLSRPAFGLDETGNPEEVEAALSAPGTVFHATADMGRTYLPVPDQESTS